MKEIIKDQIRKSIMVKESLSDNLIVEIEKAARKITDSLKNGGKLLICGNGGSAADSQHFAAELLGRFEKNRKALPAIALTTDTSTLTAIGNDYDFESVFARQIEALGQKGDILFAISTSGNSANIFKAIVEAKKQEIFTIGLSGQSGGKISTLCDLILKIPSQHTARIQESHILIIHIISYLVEQSFSLDIP